MGCARKEQEPVARLERDRGAVDVEVRAPREDDDPLVGRGAVVDRRVELAAEDLLDDGIADARDLVGRFTRVRRVGRRLQRPRRGSAMVLNA